MSAKERADFMVFYEEERERFSNKFDWRARLLDYCRQDSVASNRAKQYCVKFDYIIIRPFLEQK